ncbi:MAG: hypothetical protein WBW16_13520 [Bacteroidota bacterium]
MRKLVTSILILTLPFILGCEKRLFRFVATIDQTSVFTLSSVNGNFAQEQFIARDDVLGKLDIPKKAHITDVKIESLSLKVIKRSENKAPAMTVYATVFGTRVPGKMFDPVTVPLVGVDAPFIGLNALIESAIDGLKDKFKAYIQALDHTSFSVQVTGNSVPTGQQIALDLQLIIKATVEYEECVDTIPGTGGASCEENIYSTSP